MRHPVDQVPRPLPLAAGAVQHVAAMYAGVVAPPLGVGLVPIVAPDFHHGFPGVVQTVMDSGISAGTITAVVLNLLMSERKRTTLPV